MKKQLNEKFGKMVAWTALISIIGLILIPVFP